MIAIPDHQGTEQFQSFILAKKPEVKKQAIWRIQNIEFNVNLYLLLY